MKPINKKDYDATFSLGNRDLKCYSRKKLASRYPTGNYELLGETCSHNRESAIAGLDLSSEQLVVSAYGSHSRLKYSRRYFLAVGRNQYICLLKSRLFPLLFFLLVLGILLSCILSILIFFRTPVLAPDYPLPTADTHATRIENDHTAKSDSETGGGSVRLRFSRVAKVNLSTGLISILYQNPNQSNQDSVLTLVLVKDGQEYILARSGLVKAGTQLTQLQLNTSEVALAEGVYQGKFFIDHYHPTTGEKALANSSLDDVEIQVRHDS